MNNDMKLCECGCGEPAPIAKIAQNGFTKGQPQRFISGHQFAYRKLKQPYIVDPQTGCWVWQGSKSRYGHGRLQVNVNGKKETISAHRYYYELHKGPIPEGLDIDHLCHNPPCVNPKHLEPVTPAINARRGNQTRFTADQIEEIRRLWGTGTFKQYELAERYDTTQANISLIVRRKNWRADGEPFENVGRNIGSEHHNSKLTEDIVAAAITRNRNGESCSSMAREYGVTISSLNYAIRGITWRHVFERMKVAA